jgi:hypothetical protein
MIEYVPPSDSNPVLAVQARIVSNQVDVGEYSFIQQRQHTFMLDVDVHPRALNLVRIGAFNPME